MIMLFLMGVAGTVALIISAISEDDQLRLRGTILGVGAIIIGVLMYITTVLDMILHAIVVIQ